MDDSIIGSAQFTFSTISSTNRVAHLLLSKTRPRAGTVISATNQSAGEGQYGRSWFGNKGKNLCLSVILYPQIVASAQFTLSAFVSLAIRDTVQYYTDKRVSIKWPNDIYIDDKKVAGILIQNSISGQKIQNSIIGIGININEIAFPEGLPNPTSLTLESGIRYNLNQVKQVLLQNLNEWNERAKSLPLSLVKKQYVKHLYKCGEVCVFDDLEDQNEIDLRIVSVDDFGRILLENIRTNEVKAYTLNQIRHSKL